MNPAKQPSSNDNEPIALPPGPNADARCAKLLDLRPNVLQKSLPNPKGEPSAAPDSGKTGKKQPFVHDYSVRPTTYVYRMEDNAESFSKYPLMTSKKLSKSSSRPRGVRMTAKDFMDDSLYNPYYGYFSRNVEIFTTDKPFDYTNINDVDDFLNTWTGEYSKYAANSPTLTGKTKDTSHSGTFPAQDKDFTSRGASKQLWHTPTELFKPYYGEALARYLLVNYKLSLYPYKDLIIYEMGGGNGTLMTNILDYIRDTQPEVYERTRYKVIEISDQLAHKQQSALHTKASETGHRSKVEIINKSIFDWKEPVNDPCFFVALEVFDNFAHDIVRYDNRTLQPYQGHVLVDANGDFHEVYTQKLDEWTKLFLQIRTEALEDYSPDSRLGFHPLSTPWLYKEARNLMWPFHSELSDPEFIPTRYLEFLYILKKYFPRLDCCLLISHICPRPPLHGSPDTTLLWFRQCLTTRWSPLTHIWFCRVTSIFSSPPTLSLLRSFFVTCVAECLRFLPIRSSWNNGPTLMQPLQRPVRTP